MLNDLAQQNADLEKDNDLLRGQINELTNKVDYIMKKVGGVSIECGIGTLKQSYEETLKKK